MPEDNGISKLPFYIFTGLIGLVLLLAGWGYADIRAELGSKVDTAVWSSELRAITKETTELKLDIKDLQKQMAESQKELMTGIRDNRELFYEHMLKEKIASKDGKN